MKTRFALVVQRERLAFDVEQFPWRGDADYSAQQIAA